MMMMMRIVLNFVLFVGACFVYANAETCKDADREAQYCKLWKEDGFCQTQVEQMKKYCRKTCGFCGVPTLAPGETLPPHQGGCGKPEVQGIRVIAGKTAVRGSWPWQILLMYGGAPMCGGTIVSPRYVVTAAHCVYGRENDGQFSVRVGEHNWNVVEGSEVEVRVIQVLRHQAYDPQRFNNDIAVLYLEKPVKFNKYVSPACLPKNEVPPGTNCYITGWGKVSHPGMMNPVLQQGVLSVVSNRDCYRLNSQRYPGIAITQAMICGGSGGTERTSGCHGDSGGPYVCEVNGIWELHGSVSFGSPSCDSRDMYTTFSRTHHFVDWIKQIMER